MLLIKNGRVIDPKRGIDDVLDLVIDDGKIRRIGKYQRTDDYERILEAEGLIVAPGLVDIHADFCDPGAPERETVETGAAAAAKGGFTTVVCMPGPGHEADTPEAVRVLLEKGKKTGVRILACGAVTGKLQGESLTDMEALKESGVCGFSDGCCSVTDETLMKAAMEEAVRLKMPLSLHEEDPNFAAARGIAQGETAEKLGLSGTPAMAEELLVARDCILALNTGARVNIQHISSGNSVAIIALARSMGARVSAEAAPLQFSLNEDALLTKGTLAKVDPPLRTVRDRYELIEGLKNNTIDIIASDHRPVSEAEKALPLDQAPAGSIGLETALALGISKLVRRGHLTLMQLIAKMSLNPAEFYGLDLGCIEEGACADLVIFDENEQWTVEKPFASKSANTPFLGETLHGKVKYTICEGKVIYDSGKEI